MEGSELRDDRNRKSWGIDVSLMQICCVVLGGLGISSLTNPLVTSSLHARFSIDYFFFSFLPLNTSRELMRLASNLNIGKDI
jgi:hypothetical protein